MTNTYYRVYAQIDLDAIEYNIEQMHQKLPQGMGMFAVIKTDGYGHGALPIARLLEDKPYIVGYAVATLEEGLILRRNGIQKKILILGYSFPEQYETLLANDLSPAVYRKDMAEALSAQAQRMGKTAHIHLKVDTGMSRIGIVPDEEGFLLAKSILSLSNLYPEGIFTHFAKADEYDKTSAKRQLALYLAFVKRLEAEGHRFELRHISNSAGILEHLGDAFDAVRAGIALYGVYPSAEVDQTSIVLRPALTLKSTIVHLKQVPEGTFVSYGGTFETKRPTTIATIPVGYGDGYPRLLSNRGYVLIRGEKAPIIGRVCMDQFMVDVTDIADVAMRDVVTLIGSDQTQSISVDELGELCGRFSYEFLCDLGKRIPRVYVRDGKTVQTRDAFLEE